MFNKIEFSDLYRFLTSIGLIFIASAFLIPWLFMKQELGVISTIEYEGLIEPSKKLVDSRINLNLNVINSLPLVSLVLFSFGVLLIFIGFKKWKKKQDGIDESDVIKLEILRASKQLDLSEIDEKAEVEVKEEIEKSENSQTNMVSDRGRIEKLKSDLIGMEKLFYDKLVEYNSFIYEPKANVKLDDRFEADIVLTPFNKKKYPDIVIEIKYLQTRLNMDVVKKAITHLVQIQSHIFNKSKRRPSLILIIVYRTNIANENEMNRFEAGVKDYVNQFNINPLKYFVLNGEEAEEFEAESIII